VKKKTRHHTSQTIFFFVQKLFDFVCDLRAQTMQLEAKDDASTWELPLQDGTLLITRSAAPAMNHTIVAVDFSGSCEEYYPELERVMNIAIKAGCVAVIFSSTAITHGLDKGEAIDFANARKRGAYGQGTSFSAPFNEVKLHAGKDSQIFFFTDGVVDNDDKHKAMRILTEIHAELNEGTGKFTTVFTRTAGYGSPDPTLLERMCLRSHTREFPSANVENFLRSLLGATIGEAHDAKSGAVTVGMYTAQRADDPKRAKGRDVLQIPTVQEALAVTAAIIAFFTRNHAKLSPKDLLKVNTMLAKFNNTPAAKAHGVQDVINTLRALAARFGAEKAAGVSSGLQALLAGRAVVARGTFSESDLRELADLLTAVKTGAANNPLPGTRQSAAEKAVMKVQANAGQNAQRTEKVLGAVGEALATATLSGPAASIDPTLRRELKFFLSQNPDLLPSAVAVMQAPESLQLLFGPMFERRDLSALKDFQIVTKAIGKDGVELVNLPVDLLQTTVKEVGGGLIGGVRAPFMLLNGLLHADFGFVESQDVADAVIELLRKYAAHVTQEALFDTEHAYAYGKSLSSSFPVPCGPRAMLLSRKLRKCQVAVNLELDCAQHLMGVAHAVATDCLLQREAKPYMHEAKGLVAKVCGSVKLDVPFDEVVEMVIRGVRKKAGDPMTEVMRHILNLTITVGKMELRVLAEEMRRMLQSHEWRKPLAGVARPIPPFQKVVQTIAYSFFFEKVANIEDLIDAGLGIAAVNLAVAALLTGKTPSHQEIAEALEGARSIFDGGSLEVVVKFDPMPTGLVTQLLTKDFKIAAPKLLFWQQCAVATVFTEVKPDLALFAEEDASHLCVLTDWALKAKKLPELIERAFEHFTDLNITSVDVALAYLDVCGRIADLRDFRAFDKCVAILGMSAARSASVTNVLNGLNFIDLANRLRKLNQPLDFRDLAKDYNNPAFADYVIEEHDTALLARCCFFPAVKDKILDFAEKLLFFEDAPSKEQTELAQALGDKLPAHILLKFGKQVSPLARDIAVNYLKEIRRKEKLRFEKGCEPSEAQVFEFLARDNRRAMTVEEPGNNLQEFLENMWREFKAKAHRNREDRRVAAQILHLAKYGVNGEGRVCVILPATYAEPV